MKLSDLSKPQWDAALVASRILMSGSPHREDDRARFLAATATLASLLPAGADAKDLVLQAARWDAINSIAAVCAGLPEISEGREGSNVLPMIR